MFSFELPPDLEQAARAEAARIGISLEEVVLAAFRRGLALSLPPDEQWLQRKLSPEEWRRRLDSLGRHCGVSLSDEAVSSEGIYE